MSNDFSIVDNPDPLGARHEDPLDRRNKYQKIREQFQAQITSKQADAAQLRAMNFETVILPPTITDLRAGVIRSVVVEKLLELAEELGQFEQFATAMIFNHEPPEGIGDTVQHLLDNPCTSTVTRAAQMLRKLDGMDLLMSNPPAPQPRQRPQNMMASSQVLTPGQEHARQLLGAISDFEYLRDEHHSEGVYPPSGEAPPQISPLIHEGPDYLNELSRRLLDETELAHDVSRRLRGHQTLPDSAMDFERSAVTGLEDLLDHPLLAGAQRISADDMPVMFEEMGEAVGNIGAISRVDLT